MRRVTYKSVQDTIAGWLGWDPSNLSGDEQGLINRAVNRRVQFGWEAFFWPEVTVIERRTFRPAWDGVTAWAAKAEVIYLATRKYYCALQASTNQPPADANGNTNLAYWADSQASYLGGYQTTGSPALSAGVYSATTAYVQGNQVYYPNTDKFYQLYAVSSTGNVPSDATRWGELVAFERYISYAQSGQTALGDVKEVWNLNPRTDVGRARRIPFRLQDNGVRVERLDPVVWVEFRLQTPSWTGSVWASGSFNAGDTVYYSVTGDYYTCLQAATTQDPTQAAYWTRIDFPYVLSKYVAQGAYADVDGKTNENRDALPMEADEAFAVLQFEFDKLERQQKQDMQLDVVNG